MKMLYLTAPLAENFWVLAVAAFFSFMSRHFAGMS
jgi:hypothetical protein